MQRKTGLQAAGGGGKQNHALAMLVTLPNACLVLRKSVATRNLSERVCTALVIKALGREGCLQQAGGAQSRLLSAQRAQDPVHIVCVLWLLAPRLVGFNSDYAEEEEEEAAAAWGFPPVSASCHCCCTHPGGRCILSGCAVQLRLPTRWAPRNV